MNIILQIISGIGCQLSVVDVIIFPKQFLEKVTKGTTTAELSHSGCMPSTLLKYDCWIMLHALETLSIIII